MGKILSSLLIVILITQLQYFGRVNSEPPGLILSANPTNVTLMVMGRSGAGISETVQQIMGHLAIAKPLSSDLSPPPISQYSVHLGGSAYLKFVAVEGFVDGKSQAQDAAVLSALKSNSEGLISPLPNAIVIVSPFDDTRFQDRHSSFTTMLSRVDIFLKQFSQTPVPTPKVFLFTKLMTQDKSTQRRPAEKLSQFNTTVAQHFPGFLPLSSFLVGENKGVDYGLKEEQNYIRLPNKELYPKNVLDKLIQLMQDNRDTVGERALQIFANARLAKNPTYPVTFTSTSTSSGQGSGEELGKIEAYDFDLKESEINSKLDQAFDSLDQSQKTLGRQAILELKLRFQSQNISKISQLPEPRGTPSEKTKFFQKLGKSSATSYFLLNSAFGLKMPTFTNSLVVGQGYDLTLDEVFNDGPYSDDLMKESGIGFTLPQYVTCSLIQQDPRQVKKEDKTFANYFESLSSYPNLRLDSLELENKQRIIAAFENREWKLRSGYNLAPEDVETVAQLSAVKELHTLKCEVNYAAELRSKFVEDVEALKEFDESNKDAVAEWNGFFRKYGTHVVAKAYGGGYMVGVTSGSGVRNYLRGLSPSQVESTALAGILDFRGQDELNGTVLYSFFGGAANSRLSNTASLPPLERDHHLQEWESTLSHNPTMLSYELKLVPISELARRVNNTVGEEVERVTALLLKAKLEHKRKKKPGGDRTKPVLTIVRESDKTTSSPSPTVEPVRPTAAVVTQPLRIPSTTPEARTPIPYSQSSYGSNYDNQRPLASSPPPQECPTPPLPSYTTLAPPSSTPSTEVAPPKTEFDYTDFVIGQGFHIMRDVVLSTSPFNLGRSSYNRTAGLNLHQRVVFSPFKAICMTLHSKRFPKLKDYIEDRVVNSVTNNYIHDIPNPTAFSGRLRPGNWLDEDGSTDFVFLVELRTGSGKLGAGVEQTGSAHLKPEFIQAVEELPDIAGEYSSCSEKEEWVNFFDTYGTHYVAAAIVGGDYEVRLRGVNLAEGVRIMGALGVEPNEGKNRGAATTGCKEADVSQTPYLTKRKVLLSRSSLKLQFISNLFPATELSKIDWAYRNLIQGHLAC